MDDETENISPHSQKGRNSVHNTGFTLIGVLISVHETGLGVFSVSTKWDWGQILCPHLWVHYKTTRSKKSGTGFNVMMLGSKGHLMKNCINCLRIVCFLIEPEYAYNIVNQIQF